MVLCYVGMSVNSYLEANGDLYQNIAMIFVGVSCATVFFINFTKRKNKDVDVLKINKIAYWVTFSVNLICFANLIVLLIQNEFDRGDLFWGVSALILSLFVFIVLIRWSSKVKNDNTVVKS